MEDQSLPQDKKKVITLFGKRINVQAPTSPILDPLGSSSDTLASIGTPPSNNNNNDTADLSLSTSSSNSSSSEVQVLKLRLHLMEQKVKQLSELNETLSTQLTSQVHQSEDLEIERNGLRDDLMKERDKVRACEKENDMLRYKLEIVEKMFADTNHHSHPPYSPPPLPSHHSPWASMSPRNEGYPPEEYRERRYENTRYEEDPLDYERGRGYDYRPYPSLQLPSPNFPPSPPPPPRTSVFNRLGASASDLPSLPSPSPPHEEGEIFAEQQIPVETERDRELARVAALEARLDLPLDALTKKSKSEKKALASSGNSSGNKNQKRPPCKFYMETGTCKNRGACRFSHANPSKRAKLDL